MDEQLKLAPCGYVTITSIGTIKEVNQTFLDMVDYRLGNLLNKHIESIMSIANKFIFHTYFYPIIQLDGHVEELYLTLKSSKDEDIPVLLNGMRSKRNGEEVIDCVFVLMKKRIDYEKEIRQAKREIEVAYQEKNEALLKLELLHKDIETKQIELMSLNEKLLKMANTDNLTGLYNRRYFLDELDQVKTSFSILLIDVDYFKKVNDTCGHIQGDQVLFELAQIMKSLCEEKDIAARYGGEEFVLLLPDTNVEQSKQKAEEFRRRIETNAWGECPVTVSIGVTTFTSEDTNISIFSKADRALYASKNNGRNRVTHTMDLET